MSSMRDESPSETHAHLKFRLIAACNHKPLPVTGLQHPADRMSIKCKVEPMCCKEIGREAYVKDRPEVPILHAGFLVHITLSRRHVLHCFSIAE
jgi:hypothetical protein